MLLRPVTLDESALGQCLAWDLYTASGTLLAAAGTCIDTPELLHRLTQQPLFRKPDGLPQGDNPGRRLRQVVGILSDLLLEPPLLGLAAAVQEQAAQLLAIYLQDPDAALGLARRLPVRGLAVRHCLQSALVAAVMGECLGWPETRLKSLIAAALTMNLAQMRLHEHLAHGARVLTDTQREAIRQHPLRSAEMLTHAGVKDEEWLSAVRAHHEHLDGSGYPACLSGEAIPLSARILRVADYYCAKVGARHYRPPRSPEQALRELFGTQRQRLDMRLAAHLLRRLGLYPPGTLVRLANRETAVVTRQPGSRKAPRLVVSFLDYRGQLRERPLARDVTHHVTAIVGLVEMDPRWDDLPWEQYWGY